MSNAEKISSTFTLPSSHNSSVLQKKNNEVTNITPYDIHSSEQILPRHKRTKLAQLRAKKSPLLKNYLHTVNPDTYTPRCSIRVHTCMTMLFTHT